MPLPIYDPNDKPAGYLNQILEARNAQPDRNAEYQGALSQMKQAYAAKSVEGDDAAQWAAIAKGFAQPPQAGGNFWQALASAGAGKAGVIAGIEERDLGHQREAAMQHYKTSADLLKQDDLLARALASRSMGGAKGGRIVTRQQPDGTIIVLDGATGNEIRRYDPNDSKQFKEFELAFLTQAKDLETTDPEARAAWASAKAMEALDASRAAVGNRSRAPGSPNAAVSPSTPPGGNATAGASSFPRVTPEVQAGRDKERAAVIEEELTRTTAMRDAAPMGSPQRGKLNEEITQLKNEQRLNPPAAWTQPSATPLLLKETESEAEKEARGKERGSAMEKTFQDLQKTGVAADDLYGQLNIMKGMFAKYGDDIPSGEVAPLIGSIKSAMGTFGIDFKGTGATDVINGIGTMGALKSRTADGQNLLPGAMSNYEDQLLQKVFPTLGKSKEGRLLQIEVLQAQLRMRSELAQAARAHYQKTGKLGVEWHQLSADIAKHNPFLDPRRIAAMEEYAKRLATGGK